MMMHGAYDHIVLPISFLLASAFHVKLEFLDGFIECSIIVKALGLKCVLHLKLSRMPSETLTTHHPLALVLTPAILQVGKVL